MAVNSTISKFLDKAAVDDFARNNLFRVMQVRINDVLELDEDDLLYCKGGNIPARSNPTANAKFMGMEMPYNQSTVKYEGNNNYTIKFYVERNSALAKKFEAASRTIFNDLTSTGKWNFPEKTSVITVAALGFDLEPIEYITFHHVTFSGFDAIQFQTADGDGSAIEISCKFTYVYYKRDNSFVSWISK